ncbi:DUF2625 family protein [Streptomyces sp. NPDC058240]|uniref:DUF2625 family protein n=1 Tax=Streptomyces sp. NPDC058240 TaxID=3346396 RepID=UPI0036E252FE
MVWLVAVALDEFQADLRQPGWQDEVRALNSDQGLSTFPPLWSAETRQALSATSRRAVPMTELLGLARDSCRQLDGVDPGISRRRVNWSPRPVGGSRSGPARLPAEPPPRLPCRVKPLEQGPRCSWVWGGRSVRGS